MRSALLALALLAVWSAPARSDPPDAALRLFAAGNFIAAAEAADNRQTSENLAFAAYALVAASAQTREPATVDALLARAEGIAQSALRLDPHSVDARLQLALIYGLEGRRASLAHAFAQGYATRGKRLIDEALARAPNNARAHALLGAWHVEIVRRGGAAGALAFGARLGRGFEEFERARALAPNDPLIALHYAVALLEMGPEAHAEQAATLLRAVQATVPQNALEEMSVAAARTLSAALTHGPTAAQTAARDTFL